MAVGRVLAYRKMPMTMSSRFWMTEIGRAISPAPIPTSTTTPPGANGSQARLHGAHCTRGIHKYVHRESPRRDVFNERVDCPGRTKEQRLRSACGTHIRDDDLAGPIGTSDLRGDDADRTSTGDENTGTDGHAALLRGGDRYRQGLKNGHPFTHPFRVDGSPDGNDSTARFVSEDEGLINDPVAKTTIMPEMNVGSADADRATERMPPAAIARLHGHLEKMRLSAADLSAFVEADLQFHLELAQSTDNTVLLDLLQSIRSLLRVWSDRSVQDDEHARLAIVEHTAVYEAIAAGDSEAAATAMVTHMRTAGARLAGPTEPPATGPLGS